MRAVSPLFSRCASRRSQVLPEVAIHLSDAPHTAQMFRFLLLALCLALTAAFTAPASALRGSRSSIVMDGYKTGTWGAYKAPDGPQKPGAKGNPL